MFLVAICGYPNSYNNSTMAFALSALFAVYELSRLE